jgi:transposase InsO family protein
MPWRTADVMEQRIRFVVRASVAERNLSALCREFGVSRPTGYRWLRRYQEAGRVEGLRELSRRPKRSPTRLGPEIEETIEALHRRHYGCGAKKLQVHLAAAGIDLPPITIHRVLRRRGLLRQGEASPGATRRFEYAAPNELWQMDAKGPVFPGPASDVPLTILDDHSRYAVALAPVRLNGPQVHAALVEAFTAYGLPAAMLMDHGTPWWSTTNGYGLTWVSVALIEQGIRLHWSGIRHPQTQGKVERFHRTLQEAMDFVGPPAGPDGWPAQLAFFRRYYNEERPHEALGMKPPASRYEPSPRPYQPHPPAWVYPEGAPVRRLSTHGCLYWGSRYYFVSEALAHRFVQIDELDGTLLVRFRHMYVREVDLRTGSTTAVVLPVSPSQPLQV